MDYISYFKLQAKNFLRDFKTKQKDEDGIYQYTPKFFKDIDEIVLDYNVDEDNFTLMNAQHLIAYIAGFKSWSELLHADEEMLELGKFRFDHRDCNEEWDEFEMMYLPFIPKASVSDELLLYKDIFAYEFKKSG